MSNSIGVICNRLNQRDVFIKFVDDVLIDAGVVLVGVPANQMKRVVEIMDLERTNQLSLLPDKDLVDLCPLSNHTK